MVHLLSCRLLDEACTADDLATVTEPAKACARNGKKLCEGHERRRDWHIKVSFCVVCGLTKIVSGYNQILTTKKTGPYIIMPQFRMLM